MQERPLPGAFAFAALEERAPTPISGAAWLLGSGLLGLIGVGRKRFKK